MPDRRVPICHTRRRTISRVEAEYRALDRVVRRLGARLNEDVPGFGARARIKRERWTGKDALAHIVAWKQHHLRTLRREKHDATLRGKPIDVQNRTLYRRWHRRTVRDVVAYHRSVHRDVGHAAEHRERHLEPLLN